MSIAKKSKVIFITGVSGSGKSTISTLLSEALKLPFFEGDDYHPKSNVEKMASGIPLTDEDRIPWLEQLHLIAQKHQDIGCVISCSALKKNYRERLANSIEDKIIWIYLKGDFELISTRLKMRKDHFMGEQMLQSQFDALETPENAIIIDIEESPQLIIQKIKKEITLKAEIGVIGMGVMGKSLSRNLARNGFIVALYNRHVDKLEENVASDFKASYSELEKAMPFDNLSEFVESLATPRKIIVMVNAGAAVDAVIDQLSTHLNDNDIIIDAGNSHFQETNRRIKKLNEKNLHFIGTGVSGGEKGALLGPSIMPSGNSQAYKQASKYLTTIAAKDQNGNPCCTYIGEQGSGHFVKMIHNGIEYAEMQLLAECYFILKNQGKSNPEIADILKEWKDQQGSYLLNITIDILNKKEGNHYLLDLILDKAANKGTGKWATSTIADSGEPATMIPAALFARYISFFKDKRQTAESLFSSQIQKNDIAISDLKAAYQFARIINHHQGFSLIQSVSEKNNWQVNLPEVARIWTEGCIIKSDFMKKISETFKSNDNLLFSEPWTSIIQQTHPSIQNVVIKCVQAQLPIPCLTAALDYFHAIKIGNGTANLIQAQRDYFGAHTYKKKDDPTMQSYHTEWGE